MNVAFIISLAGVDRPNLIQELAKYTDEKQGKWINSRVNYLDGHIAANIKIEAPEENKASIINYFTDQEKITCYIEDINAAEKTTRKTVCLSIKSTDRSGLVADITNIVNQMSAELVHIDNHRFSVQPLGHNVFIAELSVKVDDDSMVEGLIAKLKTITDDIIVTIEACDCDKD